MLSSSPVRSWAARTDALHIKAGSGWCRRLNGSLPAQHQQETRPIEVGLVAFATSSKQRASPNGVPASKANRQTGLWRSVAAAMTVCLHRRLGICEDSCANSGLGDHKSTVPSTLCFRGYQFCVVECLNWCWSESRTRPQQIVCLPAPAFIHNTVALDKQETLKLDS
jgi:hypothetical protein